MPRRSLTEDFRCTRRIPDWILEIIDERMQLFLRKHFYARAGESIAAHVGERTNENTININQPFLPGGLKDGGLAHPARYPTSKITKTTKIRLV
jgi:hypothetical protein